jgi:hypothetical protein
MQIDFIAPKKPGKPTFICLAIVVMALTVSVIVNLVTISRHVLVQRDLSHSQAALWARSQANAQRSAQSVPYADEAISVWRQGRFLTAKALTSLEEVKVPGVQVEQLELTEADRSVVVDLQAPDYGVLVSYVQLLNKQQTGQKWQLLKATQKDSQNAGLHAQIACMTC